MALDQFSSPQPRKLFKSLLIILAAYFCSPSRSLGCHVKICSFLEGQCRFTSLAFSSFQDVNLASYHILASFPHILLALTIVLGGRVGRKYVKLLWCILG